MNFYIINNTIFERLDATKIKFAINSIAKNIWAVTTTENVGVNIAEYETAALLCAYTQEHNSVWTGDGTGIEVEELEEIEYLEGI